MNLHTLDFEDVLATVAFFFEKNPKCKFWTTYQERRYSTLLIIQHTVFLMYIIYIEPYGSLIPLPALHLLFFLHFYCKQHKLQWRLGEEGKGKKLWFYGCLHSSNRSLVHLLDRWGLQCRSVPLETFQGVARSERVQIEGPSEAIMTSNHTIHLWEITRRDSGTE